ncbi:MAG: MerR family transcriptional regulator [Acidimicrobiales bacterium]
MNDPTTPGLLAIGAFSRASSISVRTLRDYHDMGLLVPARVDRSSGYRYYDVGQLVDAMAIVRLRQLDVPLTAIRAILDARDPAVTERLLAEHRLAIERRLEETERILLALRQPLEVPDGLVETRRTADMHVLTVGADVAGEAIEGWLDRAHDQLASVADANGGRIGAPGAFYPVQLDDDAVEHVEAFVEIAGPILVPASAGVRLAAVPGTVWAVIGHRAPFAAIGDSYRLLGAWVGAHTGTAGPQVAERYLDRRPGHEHTEIWWPIAPG